MRKFLKFVLFILCIAVIAALIWMTDYYVEDTEKIDSNSVQTENNTQNNVNNEVKEEVKEEVKNEVENNTENKDEDENNENKEENTQTDENINEEINISDEAKAIDLAKKEYGTTEGVYFTVDPSQSDNTYEVCVRDNETTKALAWYTVNVKNGTVK